MTDIATRAEQAKPDDLVHRLRNPHGHSQIVMRLEAADRIEAIEAENERLREDLAFMEKALVKADELAKHAIRLAEVYERATLAGKK